MYCGGVTRITSKVVGGNQISEQPGAAERLWGAGAGRAGSILGRSGASRPQTSRAGSEACSCCGEWEHLYIAINSSVHPSASFKYFLGVFYKSMGVVFFFLFVKLVPL